MRGALASSMKNTLPGSITTPSASAASASSAASPGHLFAPFRRLGQSLLYRWYYLRDEML